jgi:hypothetical protein
VTFASIRQAISEAYTGNSLLDEAGNFLCLAGNFFTQAGNFDAGPTGWHHTQDQALAVSEGSWLA